VFKPSLGYIVRPCLKKKKEKEKEKEKRNSSPVQLEGGEMRPEEGTLPAGTC
jgi:hypothetical protein